MQLSSFSKSVGSRRTSHALRWTWAAIAIVSHSYVNAETFEIDDATDSAAPLNYKTESGKHKTDADQHIKPGEIQAENKGVGLDEDAHLPADDDIQTSIKKNNRCLKRAQTEIWVDRLRAGTHTRLCNTASWVDGLFGDEEDFRGEEFRGKVSLGFKHDEIEGIDPRLRVRIRTKLPNASKRMNAFIGRVEEDSYVSNTEVNQDRLTNVGLRSTNDEDSEWLVGLGYRTPSKDNNGWDVSVGAKLSSGFSPYSKLSHRYLFTTADDRFWRTEQTVFWRKKEGFGVSSNLDHTRIVGDHDIAVFRASVKHTEEAEQWEWFTDATWHHSFSDTRGVSSSVYARGETENAVSVPEYGMTFTYVRPVLRDWIFMETGVDFRWEREFPGQSYKSAVRFGLQFEMLLGDYYRLKRRRR